MERNRDERGNAMILGVILLMVLAGLASAFMETSVWQSRGSMWSGQRSRALYVAEAGANTAVADVLRGGAGTIGAANTPVAFGGGGYWASTVDHGDGSYTVTSVGDVSGQRRAVEVVIAPIKTAPFTKALFGQLDLDVGGSVFTDSYESDQGSYASQAVNVHPVTGDTYAGSKGHLGSNSNISLFGSVTILGDAVPGPGASVSLSGGAYVDGATTPADVATPLPPVTYDPPVSSSGDFGVSSSTTITAGTYRYDEFTAKGNAVVTVEGDVTLYIDGDFSVTAQAVLKIDNGGSLTIYHGGEDFTLTGGGALNVTQLPEKLQIYSSATLVKFTGNSGFHGVIYAPDADIEPTGTSDVHGSFAGKKISVNGDVKFHYDELLSDAIVMESAPKVASWRRVPAGD